MYSDNQKTLEQKDNQNTKLMTYSPTAIVQREQTHFTQYVDFQVTYKTICSVTTSNAFNYYLNVVFLFQSFLVLIVYLYLVEGSEELRYKEPLVQR